MIAEADVKWVVDRVVARTNLPRRLRGLDTYAVLAEMPFQVDLLIVTPEELAADVQDPRTLLGTVMPTATEIYRSPVRS